MKPEAEERIVDAVERIATVYEKIADSFGAARFTCRNCGAVHEAECHPRGELNGGRA